MNVYDFDGTIFYSDCSIGFAIWCMMRHPKLWFTFLPGMIKSLIMHKMGKLPNYLLQRKMFSYLTMIDDFDIQIERYWDKYENRISAWYLAQKRSDDLIISASPDCIIGPIARRLGVNFIATEYDREYGVFLNNLMYAKEKAKYIFDHGFERNPGIWRRRRHDLCEYRSRLYQTGGYSYICRDIGMGINVSESSDG